MKTTFYAIFDPTWTDILENKEFLKQNFSFQLMKKYRSYIISFVTLRPTNFKWNSWRKWLVFLSFLMFEPDRAKMWPWYPSNVAFLAIFAWNFHSGVCIATTCGFKMDSFLVQNMKKNLGIDNISQFLSRGLGKGVLLVGPNLHKRDLHDPRPKEKYISLQK